MVSLILKPGNESVLQGANTASFFQGEGQFHFELDPAISANAFLFLNK